MRILGLLLLPFFLFAKYFLIDGDYGSPLNTVVLQYAFLGTWDGCRGGTSFEFSNKAYKIIKQTKSGWNIECIRKNATHLGGFYCNWGGLTGDGYSFSGDFCKNKPGYFYNTKDNVWYPTFLDSNATPICPDGKIWNSETEQCLNVPKCNLTCTGAGKILDSVDCVCKCSPGLTSSGSECVPNTNLNQAACEKAGGIYLDKIPITKLFSDPKYAYLVMQVPLFSSHLCYTQNWLNTKLGKIKNALTPKKVLTAAIGLLPLGKIKYVWRGAELAEDIKDTVKNPKVLQDQKPIINTKYNPDTGVYEPVVNLKPRTSPLKPSALLQAPTDTTAQDLVGTSPNLKEFLNSPFASKGDISTEADLTDAVTEFNMDHNLRAGTQTKIADDLREIFNRSKPEEKTNFPITIKDNVGEDPEIPAEVQRTVTPVPNNANAYNVEYIITPKNAPAPVTINYYVTKAATSSSSAPGAAVSAAPAIVATPTYKLGETKYIGKEIIIKKNTSPGAKADPTISKNTAAKPKVVTTNYNSFVNPAQNAITTAFNYKISLFTCPSVSPKCPNSIEIDWNNMGIKGKYKIPDPMCAVITAIDNPKISPAITTAGNLIVLIAGILGALSLFRRN